jgi:ribosomal protein L32
LAQKNDHLSKYQDMPKQKFQNQKPSDRQAGYLKSLSSLSEASIIEEMHVQHHAGAGVANYRSGSGMNSYKADL